MHWSPLRRGRDDEIGYPVIADDDGFFRAVVLAHRAEIPIAGIRGDIREAFRTMVTRNRDHGFVPGRCCPRTGPPDRFRRQIAGVKNICMALLSGIDVPWLAAQSVHCEAVSGVCNFTSSIHRIGSSVPRLAKKKRGPEDGSGLGTLVGYIHVQCLRYNCQDVVTFATKRAAMSSVAGFPCTGPRQAAAARGPGPEGDHRSAGRPTCMRSVSNAVPQ